VFREGGHCKIRDVRWRDINLSKSLDKRSFQNCDGSAACIRKYALVCTDQARVATGVEHPIVAVLDKVAVLAESLELALICRCGPGRNILRVVFSTVDEIHPTDG
jgi:hypothetical protein